MCECVSERQWGVNSKKRGDGMGWDHEHETTQGQEKNHNIEIELESKNAQITTSSSSLRLTTSNHRHYHRPPRRSADAEYHEALPPDIGGAGYACIMLANGAGTCGDGWCAVPGVLYGDCWPCGEYRSRCNTGECDAVRGGGGNDACDRPGPSYSSLAYDELALPRRPLSDRELSRSCSSRAL